MSDQRSRRLNDDEAPDAKARMILAAEALFAEGGIDGCSLREIALKAGQGNHAAVQYHFGSREGLMEAVFDYRMIEMEPIREAMLESATASAMLGDIYTLLRIVYLPQLELRDTGVRHSYAAFLAQYLLRRQSSRFGEFSDSTPSHLTRTLALLRERTLHLPEEVAQRRLVGCSLMFVHLMLQHVDTDWSERTGETLAAGVADTINQIALCLSAPTSAP